MSWLLTSAKFSTRSKGSRGRRYRRPTCFKWPSDSWFREEHRYKAKGAPALSRAFDAWGRGEEGQDPDLWEFAVPCGVEEAEA